jgi:aldehyde dehydrogenase (NAD+)
MSEEFLNFIGGRWVRSESNKTFTIRNPADTKQEIGNFQLSTKEDAKEAVAAARAAFEGWRNVSPVNRGKILFKAADVIERELDSFSRTLTMEEGKTLAESQGEVKRAVDLFRFYGGLGSQITGKTFPSAQSRTFLYTVREPLGVVALVTPWNFPIAIPVWKMAPALVSGNTVVLKPASLTPLIAIRVTKALEEAGLPPGVLNLVVGPGGTVGEELTLNPSVEAISFTGSYEVGYGIQKRRAESSRIARVQLEMGGKNPTVVLQDAKMDEAVEIVTKSAFGLTGQACTATSRVIVDESIKKSFTAKLVERANSLRVGNGTHEDVEMGPAVSEAEMSKDLRYIEIGEEEGAKLLAGGSRSSAPEHSSGYFVLPTIFDEVSSDMRIAQEEIFGPVLSVMEARNANDAVRLANKSEYGLTASIVTSSLSSAIEFAEKVEAGVVKVNRPTTGLEYQVPFGGVKKSSSATYKEQGEEAIDFYTRLKTIYMGY